MLNQTITLINKSMLALFELKSTNKLLVLLDNKGIITKVFITAGGVSLNAFLNVSDETLENNLTPTIEELKECFTCIGKKVYVKTKPYLPTPDDLIITEVCKPKFGNQLSPDEYEKLLTPEGFDCSAIKKNLVTSTELDYSFCANDEEAKAIIASNASIFSYFKPNPATWAPNVQLAFEGVKQGKFNVVIFKGPAGTGKSILAREFAYLMNAPLLNYQVTDGTTKDDLFGSAIVNTDPTVEGEFTYVLGPVLKGLTKGWQVLLDELNMGQPSCINGLNQVGDDTNVIEHDGKQYKKENSFVLYLTMNAGYEGTNSINAALKSRMIVIDVPRLTEKEFATRLESFVTNKLSSSLRMEFFKEVFSFTEYMQETSKKYAETVEFCIRNAQKLCAAILTKPCDMKEFTAAVYASYVDFLSMDNDNTEQLNMLKDSADMKAHIQRLFDLYDYKVAKVVSPAELCSLEDIIWDTSETSTSSKSTSSSSGTSASLEEDFDELDSFLNADAKEETNEEEE